MRIPYLPGAASVPLPSLGGGRVRYRPLLAVRVTGPVQFMVRDGLLDTGSDDTVFPETIATVLGVDLTRSPQVTITLAGRGAISCRYADVTLLITDGVSETYEWPAVVGFVPLALRHPLLGYAGFLQFFDSNFRGADRGVPLAPNRDFPGRRI